MRAVVQRVSRASVAVDSRTVGTIERGLVVLLGVAPNDGVGEAELLARKIVALRIFEDAEGRMNLALSETGGAVLAISQFTLFGDVRKGNRPSFTGAARPDHAETLYDAFCDAIAGLGVPCERGVFGAHMDVSLVNDGPVTLVLDTGDLTRPRRSATLP